MPKHKFFPTENTLPQHLPLYTEAVQAQLPAPSSEPWRSLGQPGLGGPWEKKVFGKKKNPKNKHSEWELKDLQGKIRTSFVHSGQVLFT